jgi:hypothetical protein
MTEQIATAIESLLKAITTIAFTKSLTQKLLALTIAA